MALFHDEVYINKPQYRDLFMDGNECLVKGVCFMGTPLLGNGPANLLAPFVRAVKGPNKLSGANVKFLGSLRENNQSIDIPTIVRQFKSIAKEKKMRLLVGCEEISVAGSQLVYLLHHYPDTYDRCCPQPLNVAHKYRFANSAFTIHRPSPMNQRSPSSKILLSHSIFQRTIVGWLNLTIPEERIIGSWKS